MAAITLDSLEDTAKLGRLLAQALARHRYPPLLLSGELGAGKTALVRFICANWPGAETAEVSSPSFTIYNIYPGRPPVLHCDLYRCRSDIPDEVLDFIDAGAGQAIIEWAQNMEQAPKACLDICFSVINNSRRLDFKAKGESGQAALNYIVDNWPV